MKPRGKYLYMDTETHNAGKQWGMDPREFFRLGQYAWDDGPVHLTTDHDEMIELVESAPYIVAHNGHSFDWSTLYGTHSTRPLELAQERRLVDTIVLTHLLKPVPYSYTNREGHKFFDASKPAQAMKYYALDNLCFQFGLSGKLGNLQDLAKKYNPPKTLVRDLDYALIPLDDPDFLAYAEQDVVALRELFKFLMVQQQIDQYNSECLWREQELAAVLAQVTRNGIRPNTELAHSRVAEQQETVETTLDWLVAEFDFPTEGKQPWKSNAGKEAILNSLRSYGITPNHPDWTKTAKGAPSFSGDTMIAVTEGTKAERLGAALAALQGLRSIPALILESTTADGRMHPDITMFQRSGRFSVTRPGITVINQEHKDLLLADEGCVSVELDFSNADARAVAAMSGDTEFAKRFETDADGNDLYDGHNLTGEALFGKEEYYAELDDHGRPVLRPVSKMAGHAQSYNVGQKTLASGLTDMCKKLGIDRTFEPEDAKVLIQNFNSVFSRVKRWKDSVVREADEKGYVENAWGRRMPVDFAGLYPDWDSGLPRSRAYTQAPGLAGQSVTTGMMGDGLIRLARKGERWARCIRSIIHDALVVDLPEATVAEDVKVVVSCLEAVFDPKTPTGMPLNFPVGVGPLDAKNWKDGAH